MPGNVLIDTSAWVDFFRTGKNKELIGALMEERRAAFCGLIRAELLRGARGQKEVRVLKNLFSALACYHESAETFHKAGLLGCALAKKGQNIATIDLVIAQVCVDNRLRLLTYDKHFMAIAKEAEIELVRIERHEGNVPG